MSLIPLPDQMPKNLLSHSDLRRRSRPPRLVFHLPSQHAFINLTGPNYHLTPSMSCSHR